MSRLPDQLYLEDMKNSCKFILKATENHLENISQKKDEFSLIILNSAGGVRL